MANKTQWLTPIASMKNKQEVWTKLENSGWGPIKLHTNRSTTFFNNPRKEVSFSESYDRFFDYTRVLPLYDQRKIKDNSKYPPDVHENIFEQEKDKPIPAMTSLNYGLAARTPYEFPIPEVNYKRCHIMADFGRRRGVMRVIEKKPQ